ncbi:DUF6882 domain-containing protein [Actinomadura citrea]|uniref:DUF6882 domain-containing protein n=1 Tax=Actinomadura citrea TaxID=46158 RepID=UPI003CE44BCA
MDAFSDALLDLCAPHLGWAIEQFDVFCSVLPEGAVRIDAGTGVARVGDLELRADLLGTYAEDATFQWAWAKQDMTGSPAIAASLRLREIGELNSVPELTHAMVDLGRSPDPRLSAQHLGLVAAGLLGARGELHYSHGGRSLTFLATDDSDLPVTGPDPARVARALRTGADMLPGARAAEVVNGYAAHHGLAARPVAAGLELDLPGDHRVLARIEDGRMTDVAVTGPDGPVDPAPPSPPPIADDPAATFIPAGLFAELARHHASALDRGSAALGDHLAELGWEPGVPPVWDDGVARYGDLFAARAREIGVYLPGPGTWQWSEDDWDGVARLRSAAREHGADRLAADRVALPDSEVQIYIAILLARSAVHLGRARGLARIPTAEGGQRYVAITDTRVPEPASPLDVIREVVLSSAHFLQELTPHRVRYATMRAMVLQYLDAYGFTPYHWGEPRLLLGVRGLHELRVALSHDGTVNHASYGLQGTLA